MGRDQNPLVPNFLKSLREVPLVVSCNSAVERELNAMFAEEQKKNRIFIAGPDQPRDYTVFNVDLDNNQINIYPTGNDPLTTSTRIDIPPGPSGRTIINQRGKPGNVVLKIVSGGGERCIVDIRII